MHLVGGTAGLVAAIILGPRIGTYDKTIKKNKPGSLTNVMLGTFMLWWGWLGFNCGSTFGISGGMEYIDKVCSGFVFVWKISSSRTDPTKNDFGVFASTHYLLDFKDVSQFRHQNKKCHQRCCLGCLHLCLSLPLSNIMMEEILIL